MRRVDTSKMKLLLVRHLWGVNLARGFAPHLTHWRKLEYQALEASPRLVPDPLLLRKTLKLEHLYWIPQVFSNMFVGGGGVGEHLRPLREKIEECVDAQPLFFNAQSGSDAWTLAEAVDFYGATGEMEKELGVTISHETHRSRYFGNPWNTLHILAAYPQLKLTCDFSHWVCVAERLLEDCTAIIQRAAVSCSHLHARVGYEQGPQVSDPRDPEYAKHLIAHESWWDEVWAAQNSRGTETVSATPEFGPPPYLHTLPFRHEPLADLEDICDWMARRLVTRFCNQFGSLIPPGNGVAQRS